MGRRIGTVAIVAAIIRAAEMVSPDYDSVREDEDVVSEAVALVQEAERQAINA